MKIPVLVLLVTTLAAAGVASTAGVASADPASEIVVSPSIVRLENPSSRGSTSPASTFTLHVAAYDDRGERLAPTAERPLRIEVSGAPRGAIRPARARVTRGSRVTFSYDGSWFATPVTVAAWIDLPDGKRKALGRTQLLPANPVDCEPAHDVHTLRVLCEEGGSVESCALDAIRRGLKVRAAVGFDDPGGHLQAFGVDTGSIGTIVPAERLGPDAIGPGAPGRVYYDSSGRIYEGHYYLAPVAFETIDGRIVKTPRMLVLGIEAERCAPGHPRCRGSDEPGLHYLGVGFARGSEEHRFVSPADNAFLRLADGSDGRVAQGYVLTGRGITIGVPQDGGYRMAALAPSETVPGDWSPARGCYSFPELTEPNRFCGNFLLDVGVPEMFLDLPRSERPRGSEVLRRCGDGECAYVPDGVKMRVEVGDPETPAMSYDFTLRERAYGPEPTRAQWIDRTPVFMNVGRRPLFRFHYLFDATCGNVGFERVE